MHIDRSFYVYLHSPQLLSQTSSTPLPSPQQLFLPPSAEKREMHQPLATQPMAGPAAHPPSLYEEAKANLSTKALQPIYSLWSGSSASQPFPSQPLPHSLITSI